MVGPTDRHLMSKQAIKYSAGVKQRMSEANIVDSVQRESGQKLDKVKFKPGTTKTDKKPRLGRQ